MSKKKVQKFRPFTQTRYLPGEINDVINLIDLFAYNCHRYRVLTMKPVINCAPIKMNPFRLIPYNKMKEALLRTQAIDKENKNLVHKINYINRNGGCLDTFNPTAYVRTNRNWDVHQQEMKEITKLNKLFYNGIIKAEPVIKNKEMDASWKAIEKRFRQCCKYNVVIGKKTNYDVLLSKEPSISSGLDELSSDEKPKRSQCFMDFSVRDGPYLGKIIIELYEDFTPVTCQNFLEICKGAGELSYKGCVLHRIVKGKFIETGDITQNTGRGGKSIFGNTFPEENHVLKHTRAGVLSMKRLPYTENNSQFTITLTAMEKWDRMNVVFGKIIKGNGVLFKIQDYGRLIGKPYADVLISNCGVIEFKEEEEKSY